MGLAPPERQPLTTTTTAAIYNQPKSHPKPKPTPSRTMRKLSNAKDKIVDKTKKTLLRSPGKPNKEKREHDEGGYYSDRDRRRGNEGR